MRTDPVDIDFDRYSRRIEEAEDEELLHEAQDAALEEPTEGRHYRRHPGEFDVWPSDEQMEYFKRGGR